MIFRFSMHNYYIILNILSIVNSLSMVLYGKSLLKVCCMISYEPLWKTLNRKDMSTYDLIFGHGLSANTIHRMKIGKDITTKTLNELCFILKCPVSDILEYLETDED